MFRRAIEAVDQCTAGRTGCIDLLEPCRLAEFWRVPFVRRISREHEVVGYQRVGAGPKQLGKFDLRRMAIGHHVEDIILLQQSARREGAASRGNVLDLPAQFDLSLKQRISCGAILRGFAWKCNAHGNLRSARWRRIEGNAWTAFGVREELADKIRLSAESSRQPFSPASHG